MIVKNKTIQKFISFLIIISMLTPAILFSKPEKARAQFVVIDPVHIVVTTKIVVMEVLKQVMMAIVRKLLNKMTQSTINWINTGFHGNPLYLENPKSFFRDIAKYEIRNLVELYGYDSIKFPFGKAYALSLIEGYKRQLADNSAYSLSKVTQDPVLLKEYRENFNVGGWNTFLVNTQYPQNNYIGFNMIANEELARKLANTTQTAAQQVQTTLQQAGGFLSPQTCPSNPKYNNAKNEFLHPSFDLAEYYRTNPAPELSDEPSEAEREALAIWEQNLEKAKVEWAKDNTCPDGLVSTTPGSVVGSNIMKAVNSKFSQSELGAALGNSLSAIFDALINKFLTKGLNSLTDNNYQGEPNGKFGPSLNTPDANEVEDDFLGSINDSADKYGDTIAEGKFPTGGQCIETGNQYGGALREAEDTVLANNPDVGDLPNIEEGGRQNARRFLKLVESELISNGFNATVEVLNGNNNPSTGDIIGIWKEGDGAMERYDAIIGAAKTIREAATTSFVGFIPLNCTTSGGGKDCGCKKTTEEPPETPPNSCTALGQSEADFMLPMLNGGTAPQSVANQTNQKFNLTTGNQAVYYPDNNTIGLPEFYAAGPTSSRPVSPATGQPWDIVWRCDGDTNPPPTSGSAFISSVTPTTAQPGVTTITINGSNLTNQVSFYDGGGGRNTVVGTVNAAKTQTTVLVPAEQPIGNATVKIYQGNQIWSNGKLIAISSTGGGPTAEPSVDATTGWGGQAAYNSNDDNWLVVSSAGGTFGRIMGNNGQPVTSQFTIDPSSSGGPKVAFAPDMNKYLVVWISWDNPDKTTVSAIFGRFINPDGTFSGNKFLIHNDNYPSEASFFSSKSVLQYDSKNKKFVFVWEYRHPGVDSYLITVNQSGVPGPIVDVGTDSGDGSWAPVLAINPTANEYCIAYVKGNGTTKVVKKYNASTGALGPETTLNSSELGPTGFVYNSVNKKYLIGWGAGPGAGSKGKILNSCNINDGGNVITLNSAGQSMSLAYNPKSNNYATIVQNQADFGNTYTILSSAGAKIKEGVAFTGSRSGQGGNFVPFIAPNINNGTFAATSAIDYSPTRFASNLGTATTTTNPNSPPAIIANVDMGVAGVFPDVTWYKDRVWLAYRSPGAVSIDLYSFDKNLGDKRVEKIFPLNPGAGGFPRLTVSNNTLWLAFRDGESSGEDIKLWRQDTGNIESLGPGFGNDPVALGFGFVAWQDWNGSTSKVQRRLLTGGSKTLLRDSLPTGISRILINGSVVMIDQDRTAVNWGLNAWFAGPLTVASAFEDLDGAIGRINNIASTQFSLWVGQRSFNPHAATDGSGNYAVTAWGAGTNVRVALLKK